MPVLRMLTLIALVALPLSAAAQESPSRESASSAPGPYLELMDIIQGFSKRTGRKFNIDPRLRAIPMYAGIDPNRLTYEQLLATFTVHGFASIVQDDVVIVVPDASARQLPTAVHIDTNFKAVDDEWVTLLLTPKKACAPQLVPILRPLMPQAAHLAADPHSNSLVLVDRAVNVRRVADLIDKLDKAATGRQNCGGGSKAGS
jgi:general secretion pathway protein D